MITAQFINPLLLGVPSYAIGAQQGSTDENRAQMPLPSGVIGKMRAFASAPLTTPVVLVLRLDKSNTDLTVTIPANTTEVQETQAEVTVSNDQKASIKATSALSNVLAVISVTLDFDS